MGEVYIFIFGGRKMLKKFISMLLVICALVCLSACSSSNYPAYSSVTLFKCTYVFDEPVENENGGNYKYTPTTEYSEKDGNYETIEADDIGTYKWHPQNETLTLTSEDGTVEDYYVIDDYLVSSYLVSSGFEIQKEGEFLNCTIKSLLNVTEYNSDGTYTFYVANMDGSVSYSNVTTGLYYIENDLIYEKSENENEYKIGGIILDNKLIDLSLSTVYKFESR